MSENLIVGNKVITLGSPVINTTTLNELLRVLEQEGITERPIVIINPEAQSVDGFNSLIENYIENCMKGTYTQKKTTYMFQNATDEEIRTWAESQYTPGGQTLDSLIETGLIIREQSQAKSDLDIAKARSEELWKQHCSHPDSDEGSEEYANLVYNVIPALEQEIQSITDKLRTVPKDLTNKYSVAPSVLPESQPTPTTEIADVQNTGNVSEDIRTASLTLSKIANLVMPLSVAKQLATAPGNQVYSNQQAQEVPGYTTVPIEYLIAWGIRLYADGVPVVYTKSGELQRVGKSDVSPLCSSYWYPKPKFM